MKTAQRIDVGRLLQPIAGENFAGVSLRHTAQFEQVRRLYSAAEKRAGWSRLCEVVARLIATTSKDLQLAAWLVEALAHRDGFDGLNTGLRVVQGLLREYWDTAFPAPQASLDGRPSWDARGVILHRLGVRLTVTARHCPIADWPSSSLAESETLPSAARFARLSSAARDRSRVSIFSCIETVKEVITVFHLSFNNTFSLNELKEVLDQCARVLEIPHVRLTDPFAELSELLGPASMGPTTVGFDRLSASVRALAKGRRSRPPARRSRHSSGRDGLLGARRAVDRRSEEICDDAREAAAIARASWRWWASDHLAKPARLVSVRIGLPEWATVCDLALKQLAREADLEAAAWLAEAAGCLHGFEGMTVGLQLVTFLVRKRWNHLTPALDGDARERIVESLARRLTDVVRALPLTGDRRGYTLRHLESVADSRAAAAASEADDWPSRERVRDAFAALKNAERARRRASIARSIRAAQEFSTACEAGFEGGVPAVSTLQQALESAAQAYTRTWPDLPPNPEPA